MLEHVEQVVPFEEIRPFVFDRLIRGGLGEVRIFPGKLGQQLVAKNDHVLVGSDGGQRRGLALQHSPGSGGIADHVGGDGEPGVGEGRFEVAGKFLCAFAAAD